MYNRINDFLEDWAVQDQMSLRYMDATPDEVKAKKVHEYVRELDFLWWHIIQSMEQCALQAGLLEGPPTYGAECPPATMQEIKEKYLEAGQRIISSVKNNWTEADLSREFNVFGQTWSGAQVLGVLIGHGSHHRSQMSVIMRLLGLKVPGIYGPSREDWEAMGMQVRR